MDGTQPYALRCEAGQASDHEHRAWEQRAPDQGAPPTPLRAPARGPAHFRWLTRPRRTLLLLGAVWVLNVFDLGYTLLESDRGSFIEMNPVAAPLLNGPTHTLVIYKLTLVTISSVILLVLRHHRLVEISCWFLLVAYLYVATRWIGYYEDLLSAVTDPATNLPCLAG